MAEGGIVAISNSRRHRARRVSSSIARDSEMTRFAATLRTARVRGKAREGSAASVDRRALRRALPRRLDLAGGNGAVSRQLQ